ncbi:uncharacterized protein [Littorina saxatilis]|uniref:uncharacterized protein n=1 Tax=Littorina saxatilis TaxID=31220 RepID=UPI0038B61991
MVRKKVTAGIFWVCLLSVFDLTQAVPPILTIPSGKTVVTLNERTAKQEVLARGITCTSGGTVRVFMRSVSPISPCGTCFAVWPDQGVYTLYYNPGNEQLNYAVTSGYVVRVECSDGVETSQGTIEVRLLPNSPPVFTTPAASFDTHEITGADKKKVGSLLYQAASTDPDGDAVFYSLETVPNTDLFEIGRSDGIIRNTGDLRFLCLKNVVFKIKAFDDFNNPVGPREVTTTLEFKGS